MSSIKIQKESMIDLFKHLSSGSILYIILGSLFFSIFYPNSFSLSINGNGGFVGIFVKNTFLSNLVYLNQDISYYIILFLIILIFLFSINFSLKFFISFFKYI